MKQKLQFEVRQITSPQDPSFWPAMELYIESFPRDEREPVSTFVRMLEEMGPSKNFGERRGRLMVAEDADGNVIGMRLVETCPAVRLGFLVYVAVDPEFRGMGVGTRLIETAIAYCELDMLACGTTLDAVCFEVERLELAEDEDDLEVRRNRLLYFQSLGAELVSNAYIQPALTEDRDPVPLYLMAHRLKSGADRRKIAEDFCITFLEMEPGGEGVRSAVDGVEATPTLDHLLGGSSI